MEKVIDFHLNSFNFAIGQGLKFAVQNIPPVEANASGDIVKISLNDAVVTKAALPKKRRKIPQFPLYPSECRISRQTYSADLTVSLTFQSEKFGIHSSERTFNIPIMVKSDACLLRVTDRRNEEEQCDHGGYFIVNGKERLFRTYLLPRRNYPLAIKRPSWKRKVKNEDYTEFGVQIRSVAEDETNSVVSLHFLANSTVNVRFSHNGYYHFVSFMLLLKVLYDETDSYIYKKICSQKDELTKVCILRMLRQLHSQGIYTQVQAKIHFGQSFQSIATASGLKYKPVDLADYITGECILNHLKDNTDKANLLCYMINKLFAIVQGKCSVEDPDNFIYQELLLGGQIYLMLLKLELKNYVKSVSRVFEKLIKANHENFILNEDVVQYCMTKAMRFGAQIISSLGTGNIPAAKLGLKESSGCSFLCERTNLLQFYSYFTTVEKICFSPYASTSLRRLQPEYWGFLCPIHTPSGKTTGLTNHITQCCLITGHPVSTTPLMTVISYLGIIPECNTISVYNKMYAVFLDGKIIGYVPHDKAEKFALDVKSFQKFAISLSKTLEIIILHEEKAKDTEQNQQLLYPGIFIFTTPGRMMRPVKTIGTGEVAYIGTFENAFLNIALSKKEAVPGIHSHYEISYGNVFSSTAKMIPFFEFNQSPRNIYSCHMMKQAVGIPCHASSLHSDKKLYYLEYPQTPLVCTSQNEEYVLQDYPLGTNAIIAVISYTGYDMEDAIVINKSSLERGFTKAFILKSELIDLQEKAKTLGFSHEYALKFGRNKNYNGLEKFVDIDGLPHVGLRVNYGDPFCSYIETRTEECHLETYQSSEPAIIYEVKLLGNYSSVLYLTKVLIKFLIARPVEIGDKFANRHGQKGIMSKIWPQEDMPYTSSGIVPDILFNPNSFPSRMTMGMTIESLAGLVSAASGKQITVSPFEFSEKYKAIDYFGKKLRQNGFNLYGTHTMTSGISGEELQCHIFTGIVYYQRLRHMVVDKYQVRSYGKVSSSLQQPVKAAPRDAAIRFGEMERDSIISHGASSILQDRLLVCSDMCTAYLCSSCGTLYPLQENLENHQMKKSVGSLHCIVCKNQENHLIQLHVPYVFLALVAELSAANIKVNFSLGT